MIRTNYFSDLSISYIVKISEDILYIKFLIRRVGTNNLTLENLISVKEKLNNVYVSLHMLELINAKLKSFISSNYFNIKIHDNVKFYKTVLRRNKDKIEEYKSEINDIILYINYGENDLVTI